MRNLMIKAVAYKQARPVELRDEEGQTVIEYALIVAVVSVALIALMTTFGKDLVTGAVSKVNFYKPV